MNKTEKQEPYFCISYDCNLMFDTDIRLPGTVDGKGAAVGYYHPSNVVCQFWDHDGNVSKVVHKI